MRLLLDTNVLRRLCYPKQHVDVLAWFQNWLKHAMKADDIEIAISAAADYELRRSILWKLDKHPAEPEALKRLDDFCRLLEVQPVLNDSLLSAARLWADAKRGGYSTGSERDVDWDVIIAAQAREREAVVVTNNVKHLRRYGIQADDWDALPPPS